MRGGTKLGVFDHMDSNGRSLEEQIKERLRLADAYDRNGFHAYHLAEHHATPLGRAPSPSVYLAAVAQRTRRLRFGPLVYALATHHHARPDEWRPFRAGRRTGRVADRARLLRRGRGGRHGHVHRGSNREAESTDAPERGGLPQEGIEGGCITGEG